MKRLLPLALIALILSACATRIPIARTQSADITLPSGRRIAVLEFDYHRYGNSEDPFAFLRFRLSGKLFQEYESTAYQASRYATGQLAGALAATKFLTVVDSDSVISRLKASGAIEANAAEIGSVAGADSILAGQIDVINRDTTTEMKNEKLKDPATGVYTDVPVPYITAVDTVTISYTVIDAATGETLGTRTLSGQETSTARLSRKNLVSEINQYKLIISKLVPDIVRQLAPHQVRESLVLAPDKSKDPGMGKADRLVRAKSYAEALGLYLGIWESSRNPAAGIDAALLREATGDLDGALALMDSVASETGDAKAAMELARLTKLKADEEKLAEQLRQ
jgi:hypothetical protein